MITSLPERPSQSHPYYHSAEKKERKKNQQQTFQGPSNVEKSSNYHSAGGFCSSIQTLLFASFFPSLSLSVYIE